MKRTFRSRRQVVVISIDGTPYSLLQRLMAAGHMPHFSQLVREGDFHELRSVYPAISSVAWSSFMTGQNPAKHGIFGFVDRQPGTLKTFVLTARHMQSRTLWEVLSAAGKRVLVMNVPVTYPPRPVNGILVGDFLSPDLQKAAYPPSIAPELEHLGYIIDVDAWEGRQNKAKLLMDVTNALVARERALFHFMAQETWDYVHCHVMETDRLHHFLWEEMELGDPRYAPGFFAFYQQVDAFLGRVRERLAPQTTLIVLSDHGFCRLRQEVYVNTWLRQHGWLRFAKEPPKVLEDMDPASVAYALDPGRIYLNLRGREPHGTVSPGDEYERRRDEIIAAALALTDPDSGAPIIARAMRREEVYHGPLLERAADIILHPHNGYDLKGALYKETLTFKGSELVGMHTYEDASLYIRGRKITAEHPWVADLMPTVLRLLDVPLPPDLDGTPLVR